MSIEDSFNKNNRRPRRLEEDKAGYQQRPSEDEDLFDDVEIESRDLFDDETNDGSYGDADTGYDDYDDTADDRNYGRSKGSSRGYHGRDDFDDSYDDDYEDDFGSYSDRAGEDEIVDDLDMGDKLLSGGLYGTDSRSKRKKLRELNTPESVIDGRKKRSEQKSQKKGRIKRIVICAIVELLTLCAIFAYGYVLRTFNLMQRTDVDIAKVENDNISIEKKQEMEGYWNIAVFGLDASQRNSDVIMIVSVNQDTGDIRLCSIFRDTYLNITDNNQYNKINQAYAQGGPEQALAALNKNLDLNITNYVTFNWKTIAQAINMLDGVDNIEISKAEFYYINAFITETVKETGIGTYQLKSAGAQHLDGVQAVAYARLRLMDSDFARTERQKKIIMACFDKVKKMDYSELNYIMMTIFPEVETNVSLGEVVSMAQGILRYNIAETGGFPWQRGDARIPNKGSCVIPTTLESNVKLLHEFLFDDSEYEVSDAVLSYSAKIKQDSNLYKEGTVIESVATDQGVIQKPKVSQEGIGDDEDVTEAPTEKERDEEDYTLGVDENGELIYPTDEDGDIVIPTDADGNVIYPTDAEGNEIRGTTGGRHDRPTSIMEESEGDEGSEIVDDDGNVIGTSPTRETGGRRPTETQATDAAGRPIMNQTESAGPGGSTRPSESSGTSTGGSRPGGSTGTTTGSSEQAPGGSTRPTDITEIPDEPVTVPSTTQAAPGGSTTPGGSVNAPGGSSGQSAGPSGGAPGSGAAQSGADSGGVSTVTGPGM